MKNLKTLLLQCILSLYIYDTSDLVEVYRGTAAYLWVHTQEWGEAVGTPFHFRNARVVCIQK